MIDHIGFSVRECRAVNAFYRAALAPLGYDVLMEFDDVAGFGVAPKPDFWIARGAQRAAHSRAFRAELARSRRRVLPSGMAAGGRDNGPPGLRPHYHPNYYGAFVLDPDGHNIEAVCHLAA